MHHKCDVLFTFCEVFPEVCFYSMKKCTKLAFLGENGKKSELFILITLNDWKNPSLTMQVLYVIWSKHETNLLSFFFYNYKRSVHFSFCECTLNWSIKVWQVWQNDTNAISRPCGLDILSAQSKNKKVLFLLV